MFRVLILIGLSDALLVLAVKRDFSLLQKVCRSGLSGCASTLHGPYQRLLGVDLAYWGIGFFLVLLALELLGPGRRRWQTMLLFPGLAVALGLTWIQVFWLSTLCTLCLLTVGVTLALVLTLVIRRPSGQLTLLALPFLLALSGLHQDPPNAPERLALPPAVAPYLMIWQPGRPGGGHVLVLFDYACSHCRQLLPDLTRLSRDRPDLRIEMLYLPILTSSKSEQSARVALAAQQRGDFPRVHRRLCLEFDSPGSSSDRAERTMAPGQTDPLPALRKLGAELKVYSVPHVYLQGRRKGSQLREL